MSIEDSSVSRRTGFRVYFWDTRDSVFVNGFLVSISLCVLKMSALAVELGSWIIFCSQGRSFRQRF
jgi:hypothetical protein